MIRRRWDARAWLLWAALSIGGGVCYLAGMAMAVTAAGRGLGALAGYAAWYAAVAAAATVLTVAWQLGRPPRR